MESEINTPDKYAFVGAASTGKTTIFEALREEYLTDPSIVFIEESGRPYFESRPYFTEQQIFSPPVQKELQGIILGKEQSATEQNPQVIICDRSVLDSPAHLYAMGDEEGTEELLENVQFWLSTYKLILLLDPEGVPFENDEARRESEQTRNRIHQGFIDFFAKYKIPYELLSGSKEERIARVKGLISKRIRTESA